MSYWQYVLQCQYSLFVQYVYLRWLLIYGKPCGQFQLWANASSDCDPFKWLCSGFARYFSTDEELQKMTKGILHVGAKRFPVQEIYLEDLCSRLHSGIPNDVMLSILQAICSMNRTSAFEYLTMSADAPPVWVWSFEHYLSFLLEVNIFSANLTIYVEEHIFVHESEYACTSVLLLI